MLLLNFVFKLNPESILRHFQGSNYLFCNYSSITGLYTVVSRGTIDLIFKIVNHKSAITNLSSHIN
ncbi:MAG: hypothetical protein RL619_1019 [Bacteroidota bacterium]|jgi:hypothetical protein